jgi:hypothetical protein
MTSNEKRMSYFSADYRECLEEVEGGRREGEEQAFPALLFPIASGGRWKGEKLIQGKGIRVNAGVGAA